MTQPTTRPTRPGASFAAALALAIAWAPPTAPAQDARRPDGPAAPPAGSDPPSLADSAADPPAERPWSVARRVVSQGRADGQTWQVDYLLRNDGPFAQVLVPGSASAEVEGWVSNSRVADHATPRLSALVARGPWGPPAAVELVVARDEARRCRERATLRLWPDDDGRAAAPPPPGVAALALPIGPPPIVVPPGGGLRVRLTLEHDHFLYGPYEPLLGPRSLVLRLGASAIRDALPLDRELRPDRSVPAWPPFEPPADRLDSRVFLSAPHSVHLAAHRPGNASYRLSGPVRYATRMRLSFWYLVAPGTRGDCKARVTQYKQDQARGIYRMLHDGDQDHALTAVGRWTRVERVIRTEPEATVLAIDFKLGTDVGEMWIDDVALEPLDDIPAGP